MLRGFDSPNMLHRFTRNIVGRCGLSISLHAHALPGYHRLFRRFVDDLNCLATILRHKMFDIRFKKYQSEKNIRYIYIYLLTDCFHRFDRRL